MLVFLSPATSFGATGMSSLKEMPKSPLTMHSSHSPYLTRNARPALADQNANIAAYDTIVLAYPIWWGQAPRILDTFVESYDFSGKTIVPICTSGGSDIGSSAGFLKGHTKGTGNWKNGKQFGSSASENEIKDWLNGLGVNVPPPIEAGAS